ncbi:6-phosphofructokinase [Streptomyces cirratus]
MYGHERFAGIGNRLAVELEDRLGKEARPVILGHVQRGGTPTAYDRVLATRFGWHAVEAAHRGQFGMLTALRGTDIVMVPLADAVRSLKTVPVERYAEAETVL